MGVERAKPSACILCRFSLFFTVSEMFLSTSFRAAEPKILSKKKKLPYRECFKGALSLAERPLFVKQSPGLFHKFTPAERTASSASRKCVSFFGIPDLESFSSCEKAYESVPCANKGLCPFETCKPLKRLDLNFLTSLFGRIFTHAGVLAVFKPRKGRLKMSVAPTGKPKVYVFSLRRAKKN